MTPEVKRVLQQLEFHPPGGGKSEPISKVYLATLNREAWLEALTEKLRPLFAERGWPLPPADKLQFAVGFPSTRARSNKNRRIGECWSPHCTPDGTIHILVSPVVASAVEAGGVLTHELVHAAVGSQHGHDATFRSAMGKVGLTGKATATVVGPDLRGLLERLITEIGPYPHQPLSFVEKEKKQTTRQRKVVCPEHATYIVRMSRQTYALGAPLCGICHAEMEMEGDEDEETEEDEAGA